MPFRLSILLRGRPGVCLPLKETMKKKVSVNIWYTGISQLLHLILAIRPENFMMI